MYTNRRTGVTATILTPGGTNERNYVSFEVFYREYISPGNFVHMDDLVWQVIDWDNGRVYQRGDREIMNKWELEND